MQIVYRGSWSHGLRTRFPESPHRPRRWWTGKRQYRDPFGSHAWREHGHHLDPRYNDVILHVVLDHDGSETRRSDGRIVPTVVIAPDATLLSALGDFQVDWNLVGGDVCADAIARDEPEAIRAALWQLGDQRLGEKVTQLSARLDRELPADVLFEQVLDGLGYSSNREPMRAPGSA